MHPRSATSMLGECVAFNQAIHGALLTLLQIFQTYYEQTLLRNSSPSEMSVHSCLHSTSSSDKIQSLDRFYTGACCFESEPVQHLTAALCSTLSRSCLGSSWASSSTEDISKYRYCSLPLGSLCAHC